MDDPSRRNLEEAYAEAAQTASRLSLLGAAGFGVALLMAALLLTRGEFFSPRYALEMILVVGAGSGGAAFTFLALRASRLARTYQRRMDETPRRTPDQRRS